MGDGITTAKVTAAFYRVLTRASRTPLHMKLGTCTVAKFGAADNGLRRLVLEIDADAQDTYARMLDIDRTVLHAVEQEERKQGNVAAIRTLVRPPLALPGGPRVTVSCVATTRYFCRGEEEKPVASTIESVVVGGKVHVQLELVGLRRDTELRWHYDVVATQVLCVAEKPSAKQEEECLIKDESGTEDWETESIAPESEHPMLSAALADDEPRK
jgi:hypothetical protein